MADPFAIIGLTASIISFVDFSLKIVSTGKALFDSSQDTTKELQELGLIVDDIRSKNRELQDLRRNSTRKPFKDELKAVELALSSDKLASELQGILNVLKIRPDNSKLYESGRIALQQQIKGKKIKELCDRLLVLDSRVRENMKWALQGDTESAFMEAIGTLNRSRDELEISFTSRLDDIKGDIQALLDRSKDIDNQLAQLTSLNTKLNNLDKEQKQQQRQVEIIKSLHFAQLNRRWSRIETANNFTNSWLFDESQTSFLDWLRNGKGMFWISGKPGSGKSTLMKFAYGHDDTTSTLQRWAGPAKLHTASFFFWNQGFEMQKSKVGLLQSLLYQLLRRAPEMIPQECYDHPVHEAWEFDELVNAFSHVTQSEEIGEKFCFFIDGLDEYGGEEEDLASVLCTLSQGPHVKFCVSCRNRPYLENEFLQKEYSLAIQDFTKEDMITHVRQRVRQNDHFKSLRDSDKLFREIVAKITEHAQGVWLWVSLVVRDLVRAVNRGESDGTLKRIIEEFPDDLEGYFDRIIKSIKSIYRRDSVRIFLIALEEVQPLPLYAFSLLDMEHQNPRYAIDAKISPISDQQLLDIETPWKRRIINRCGDLVLVVPEEHPVFLRNPVDFMHRTVRDFLEENLRHQAEEIGDKDYNPLLSLCNMMLYLLKSLSETDLSKPRLRKSSIHRVIGLTDELLYYAHEDDQSENPSNLTDILDEVDRVNTIHAGKLKNHWTHARDSPRTRGMDEYREGGNCNFLALAIQARLFNYVKSKLQADPQKIHKYGRPLLDYALRPRRVTPITMPYHSERNDPSVDTRIIQLLLSLGADPNQKVRLNDGRTVWELFLLSMYETTNLGEGHAALEKAWYSACELMIQYGADLDCWLDTDTGLTGRSVLETTFGRETTTRLTSIVKIVRPQNTTASWFSNSWFNVWGRAL